jgi:asparagine synthase (glutamine-hydrolysing)
MCGFTGAISFQNIDSEKLKKANTHSICRGPDSTSNFNDEDVIRYNLWFNRLAIIDLSDNANQPMFSEDNKSVIMFNGEIYNSQFLRENDLKNKYLFRTNHSDTETLLAGLEIHGISFLDSVEGQFSFFYLDKEKKKMYFARDRLGQKPMYTFIDKKNIFFASNLKSLLELKGGFEINQSSLKQYLAYGVNFSPMTLFKNINKLNAGSYIEVDYSNNEFSTSIFKYWEIDTFIDDQQYDYDDFQNLLSEAVYKRTISDVPIASFLSGGIDSTAIIKKLVELDFEPNTYSVIVKNKKYNEKYYIDQVVGKYNTNHQEVNVDENISSQIISEAIDCLDEPFGDPSIVPSYYLSKLISSDYKVAISGDGGDELLGGYSRLKNHLNNKNKISQSISNLYKFYPPVLGSGTKLKSLSANSYESYITYLEDQKFYNYLFKDDLSSDIRMKVENSQSVYKSLMISEYRYYLSDQMMFKVDRSSMANSLEVRSPFVDHKLVEYILGHTFEYFTKENQKYPLQEYLNTDFDKNFISRPKQGFVFDYKHWIFENKEMIYEVIDSSKLSNYINIKKLFSLEKFPTRINALRLWRVYVLAVYIEGVREL